MLIAVGNDFAKTVLEQKVRTHVLAALATELGTGSPSPSPSIRRWRSRRNLFTSSVEAPDEDAVVDDGLVDDDFEPEPLPGCRLGRHPGPARCDQLNPKYVFDTFVIGAVTASPTPRPSRWPRRRPNLQPLFICSESGWARPPAACHRALRRILQPHHEGAVRHSEEFTNDFINSIPRRQGGELRIAIAKSTSC